MVEGKGPQKCGRLLRTPGKLGGPFCPEFAGFGLEKSRALCYTERVVTLGLMLRFRPGHGGAMPGLGGKPDKARRGFCFPRQKQGRQSVFAQGIRRGVSRFEGQGKAGPWVL